MDSQPDRWKEISLEEADALAEIGVPLQYKDIAWSSWANWQDYWDVPSCYFTHKSGWNWVFRVLIDQ